MNNFNNNFKTLVNLFLRTSCVKLFNVNVGRILGQLLIMHFFFSFFPFKFSLLPPTHQHSNTLLSSHTSPVVSQRLCRLRSKQQFISSFIISSIPPTIASTNALPFEREMKGAKSAEFIPSLSFPLSLSLHISDARLAWSSQAYGNGAVADGRESHRQSR